MWGRQEKLSTTNSQHFFFFSFFFSLVSQCYHNMPSDDVLKKTAIGVGGVLGSMYLNSKFNVGGDLSVIMRGLKIKRIATEKQRKGEMHAYYLFKDKAKANPHRVFLVFEDRSYTFLQIEQASNRLAHWLLAQGVKKQEHVAMMLQNHPTFIVAWFAILKIGAVAAFINNNLQEDSLAHCAKVSSARIFLFDPVYDTQVSTILDKVNPATQFVAFGEATEYNNIPALPFGQTLNPDDLAPFPVTDTDDNLIRHATADDNAMLIYTSGTTGHPKAAFIRHSRCVLASFGFCFTMGLLPSDRMYACLPLYHSSASIIATLAPMVGGSSIIIARKFRVSQFWDDVAKFEATAFIYIGELCRYLLTQPVRPMETKHQIRLICGNGMRPDIWGKFRQRFQIPTIVEFYAATEGPGGLFNVNKSDFGMGAIGRFGPLLRAASPGLLVKVDPVTEYPTRNAKGYLIPCKFGEEGEFVIKLDTTNTDDPTVPRFDGYYNNKEASNKKLIQDAFTKGDLYYRTGDLLKMNSDGFIYFVDRIGDTFRWKSENVATTEVAHAISTFPGIQEANVYGTLVPNNDGRAGMAAVVLQGDLADFDFKGLAVHLKKHLPVYAVPLFLRVVPAMEITGTFKQQKVLFRNQGIDLSKVPSDQPVYWLSNNEYVPFRSEDHEAIVTGKAKL
ncbi:acetyl-CoA synthetase-like protein [Hesseltinella vesiculosa]|uniref:Very long-chain fatty acid transport protein n=1 Tax=Hesseltinella vesiculosa TaxID=101127 RepID=A0A1X2G572_9FUNG|nr:acetyl-CoA synthetase-like protein [Hesseltinella vesiculosa]